MLKKDFFIKAMNYNLCIYKEWIIKCFSIVLNSKNESETKSFFLFIENNKYCFYNPEINGIDFLDDAETTEPAFKFLESIDLKAGDIENLKEDISSTYGNLLVNKLVLVNAFKDKIPYQTGSINVKTLEGLIAPRLKDDPEPNEIKILKKIGSIPEETENPNDIYVHEYLKFNQALVSLAGLSMLCVTPASKKSMTSDPLIIKKRTELINEYKDRLEDPVIQAKINNELSTIDRNWIKGDSTERFYINSKSFDVARLKMFGWQGSTQGFGIKGKLITTSLNEGWLPEDLPEINNSLRDGSYKRGAQTALGGEEAKFNYRIFLNTTVAEIDCGTQLGLSIKLMDWNFKKYVNNYLIDSDGKNILLTNENIKNYLNQTVKIRSAAFCKTSGANFCQYCMGIMISQSPQAIGTFASDIGSMFLTSFLKAMHGKALKTAKLKLDQALT